MFWAGTRGHIARNPALAGLSAGFIGGTKAGTKRGQSGDTSIYERKKILHSYIYKAYHLLARLPPPGLPCTLAHLHGHERERGLPLGPATGRGVSQGMAGSGTPGDPVERAPQRRYGRQGATGGALGDFDRGGQGRSQSLPLGAAGASASAEVGAGRRAPGRVWGWALPVNRCVKGVMRRRQPLWITFLRDASASRCAAAYFLSNSMVALSDCHI
jgi:hypothetical protein